MVLTIFISFGTIVTATFADGSADTQNTTQPSSVDGEILIKYKDESVNLRTSQGQEISSDIIANQ